MGSFVRPCALALCAATLAPTALAASEDITLQEYAIGLTNPLGFVQDPSDDGVQYVVQQNGVIRVVLDGSLQPTAFIDVGSLLGSTSGERGLLGLAFPPDYATSGFFYLSYTDGAGDNVVARAQRSGSDPLQGVLGSVTPIFGQEQPASNHNGGHIEFGPDGYLYLAIGDGGPSGDAELAGQDRTTLLGTIIRIDVSNTALVGYEIPNNPWVTDENVLDEIWHFGVRNPWRYTFDVGQCGTGAMYIADVGESTQEEISYQPPGVGGLNLGWACKEGLLDFFGCDPPADAPFHDPFHTYSNEGGQSVTGGYVYRGAEMTLNRGRYFFGDFINGMIWSIDVSALGGGGSASDLVPHLDAGFFISSFGRDADGELYVLDYFGGRVMRIHGTNTPGNIDGAGVVDGEDLASLLAAWGAMSCGASDIDNNGTVDGMDLAALLAAWGQ